MREGNLVRPRMWMMVTGGMGPRWTGESCQPKIFFSWKKVKFSVHPKPVKLLPSVLVLLLKPQTPTTRGWTFESAGGWVFVEKFFHFYYFWEKKFRRVVVSWAGVGWREGGRSRTVQAGEVFFFQFHSHPSVHSHTFSTHVLHTAEKWKGKFYAAKWGMASEFNVCVDHTYARPVNTKKSCHCFLRIFHN